MSKAVVVYESRYGNTRRVAETIAEGLQEINGTEAVLTGPKDVDADSLAEFDAIVIGSPNHAGTATWGIKRFINRLGDPKLDGKLVAMFDTYLGRDKGKAVRKMEGRLHDKAPGLKIVSPGLSIEVEGIKGPITTGEVPRCREFGRKVAGGIGEESAQT